MTPAEHNQMIKGRDYILVALTKEMNKRERIRHGWIERERLAVTVAANQWAEAHGIARRITVDTVKYHEDRCVGHIDYASKLALYVAEDILGFAP